MFMFFIILVDKVTKKKQKQEHFVTYFYKFQVSAIKVFRVSAIKVFQVSCLCVRKSEDIVTCCN